MRYKKETCRTLYKLHVCCHHHIRYVVMWLLLMDWAVIASSSFALCWCTLYCNESFPACSALSFFIFFEWYPISEWYP